jgi:RNA polymerase sigma-70 factor (ECF subfamily)
MSTVAGEYGSASTARPVEDVVDAAALNRFLASVERRAFRIAEIAVRNRDDALDIVQDTMLVLARRYGQRPAAEWTPLFYTILRSRITDFQRRSAVRRRVFGWFGGSTGGGDGRGGDGGGDARDPLESVADGAASEPDRRLQLDAVSEQIVELVARLPARQQQAFLLRAWEGLDVAATAGAMGCSEGSVKTHYSRAVHTLRGWLEDHVG